MYCNRHGTNNCIECAIEAQTKAIVEAIRPSRTKKPGIPRPSKPIGPGNETIKPVFNTNERLTQLVFVGLSAFLVGMLVGAAVITN